jgi:hypothetical protein
MIALNLNQRFTRRVPPELTKRTVEFTSDKPKAQLDDICRGLAGNEGVSILMDAPYFPNVWTFH